MMTIGGTAHILWVIASIIIVTVCCFVVRKVSYKWQCVMICSCVGICMVGILFLHLTHYGKSLDFANFFQQMFQVCNFNFVLLPLCLIKKNELARQYLFFFSMFAAMSTFVTYTSDVEGSMWYSIVTINFWVDHLMVVLVCLMMVSAGWFKPRKEYVFKVCLCLLAYFGACFFANFAFNGWSISGPHNHSYTMSSGSIMILEPLYKLIPIPFVYLLPLFPIFMGLFYLLAFFFKKYTLPHNPYSDANIFPKQIKASQFPQNNQ